jgi:hypothetical protein
MTTRNKDITAKGLIPLDLVIPSNFLKACGCCGRSGFIGLWWMTSKDELASEDGHCCVVGMRWPAWLVFWDKMGMYLGQLFEQGIDFGASHREATHMLLVERETRRAYAIDIEAGHEFLSSQTRTISSSQINDGFKTNFTGPGETIRWQLIPRGLRNEKQIVNAFHALRDELGLKD